MEKYIAEELNDIYEELTENGVTFYYTSENVSYGEITNLEFKENDIINIEINEVERYDVEIEDFIDNHSLTGVNYHSWNKVRRFNLLLEEV